MPIDPGSSARENIDGLKFEQDLNESWKNRDRGNLIACPSDFNLRREIDIADVLTDLSTIRWLK